MMVPNICSQSTSPYRGTELMTTGSYRAMTRPKGTSHQHPAIVFDPVKRHQIEAKKKWAEMQIPYFTGEGLLPEAERMKKLVRACDLELEEMDLIEKYRRDGQNVAIIRADDLDIL